MMSFVGVPVDRDSMNALGRTELRRLRIVSVAIGMAWIGWTLAFVVVILAVLQAATELRALFLTSLALM